MHCCFGMHDMPCWCSASLLLVLCACMACLCSEEFQSHCLRLHSTHSLFAYKFCLVGWRYTDNCLCIGLAVRYSAALLPLLLPLRPQNCSADILKQPGAHPWENRPGSDHERKVLQVSKHLFMFKFLPKVQMGDCSKVGACKWASARSCEASGSAV